MIIEIASGKHKLVIDSIAGGRAIQWIIDDLQILGPKGDHPLIGGWYLMAPWAGRIRDNQVVFKGDKFPQDISFKNWAFHGTVFLSEGKIRNQSDTSVEIVHKTNDKWPVKMEIVQKWSITSNFVKCQVTVSSTIGEFPAEIGWRPTFKRQLEKGKPAKFGIEAISQYVKDESFFTLNKTKPIGIPPFDDAFDVPTGKGFIEWSDALRIDFSSDVDTFVIFDDQEDVFCIEPQTGPPDAINQARHIISPGKPLEASVKWEVTRL
jgi:aldose 1-epimerase